MLRNPGYVKDGITSTLAAYSHKPFNTKWPVILLFLISVSLSPLHFFLSLPLYSLLLFPFFYYFFFGRGMSPFRMTEFDL